MSVYQSIPPQGLANLDSVQETELGPVPTGWQWSIDVATSVVDDTVRLWILDVNDADSNPDQEIEIVLSRAEFTELLARLLAVRDRLEQRDAQTNQEPTQ